LFGLRPPVYVAQKMGESLERSKVLQRPMPETKANPESSFVGIDFGAKAAGTTCLCWLQAGQLKVYQSQKGQDADAFVLSFVGQHQPRQVFIDAPLSLPAVYGGAGGSYFYRACDVALGAMSPMFLGGLTARAMQLAYNLQQAGVAVHEVYPAAAAKHLLPEGSGYKTNLPQFATALSRLLPCVPPPLANWHQADSVLAWLTGYRHSRGLAIVHGHQAEGFILI